MLSLAEGGAEIAYKGLLEGNLRTTQKWCVVIDGVRQNAYNQIFDLVFSPDTKHLSYVAMKGTKMILVVDGKETEPHDLFGRPVFSYDSQYFAYTYKDGQNFYFKINDKINGPFDKFGKFFFSPDSSQYAYIVSKNEEKCTVL